MNACALSLDFEAFLRCVKAGPGLGESHYGHSEGDTPRICSAGCSAEDGLLVLAAVLETDVAQTEVLGSGR